jgi:hypothetical protein
MICCPISFVPVSDYTTYASCRFYSYACCKNAKTFWVLFASVNNVLGYDPVFGYNYSYNGMIKQPITPTANRFYFVGCFISWGVDRSQDAINNNL